MTHILPVALVVLALMPQQKGDRPPGQGLPLRYTGEEGISEVPLDTRELGWQPQPTRAILIERRDLPPGARDGELDEKDAPDPNERAVPINIGDRALMSVCFDHWLYGNLTEQKRGVWLLTVLSEKVVAARKRGLSAAEEEKLILAGRGDIKRFLDRIEEERAEFERVRKDYIAGRAFLQEPDLRLLATEFHRGPFGEDSLFHKTLVKIERDRARKKSG